MLAVILLVGAAVVGLCWKGRLAALADLPLRGRWLVVGCVGAQLFGGGMAALTGSHFWYPAGLALTAAAGLGFCARNLRIAGVPLVALGLLLNALVVLLNGTMPVSLDAAARANVSVHDIAAGNDPRHSLAGAGTTWRALGDTIPLPLPGDPQVVSIGDALVAAGLGELVLRGMRPERRTAVSGGRTRGAAVALRQSSEETSHGEEEAQGTRSQEEQGQPRQASELLKVTPDPR